MKTSVVPALTLAAVVAGSFAAKAEPLLLTSSQMEAVTAGQAINVSPQTVVNTSVVVLQQFNVTAQVAAAVAAATNAVAAAANVNSTGQIIP